MIEIILRNCSFVFILILLASINNTCIIISHETNETKDFVRRAAELIIHIELLNRDLLLTPHSFERMLERQIDLDELKELLESKDSQAIFQKNGNIRVTNGKLSAIIRWSGRVFYLVTVYRD